MMSRGVQFNEDQINEFHEAFLLYDNRGDGKISVNLIGDVMRALGQNPTESEVKIILVNRFNTDCIGKITDSCRERIRYCCLD